MSSPEGQPADAPSERGGKKRLVIAAALLLLAGAGVVAFQRKAAHEPVAKAVEPSEPGVVELAPFVLNLADPAGDRYFRVTVRLVLDRREIAERAQGGLAQAKLRDQILSVLSKKHAGEVISLEGRDQLRSEIVSASDQLLARPPFRDEERDKSPARVVDVYFTEFLVQ